MSARREASSWTPELIGSVQAPRQSASPDRHTLLDESKSRACQEGAKPFYGLSVPLHSPRSRHRSTRPNRDPHSCRLGTQPRPELCCLVPSNPESRRKTESMRAKLLPRGTQLSCTCRPLDWGGAPSYLRKLPIVRQNLSLTIDDQFFATAAGTGPAILFTSTTTAPSASSKFLSRLLCSTAARACAVNPHNFSRLFASRITNRNCASTPGSSSFSPCGCSG